MIDYPCDYLDIGSFGSVITEQPIGKGRQKVRCLSKGDGVVYRKTLQASLRTICVPHPSILITRHGMAPDPHISLNDHLAQALESFSGGMFLGLKSRHPSGA